jgi:HD superfamily phosphohydrolase
MILGLHPLWELATTRAIFAPLLGATGPDGKSTDEGAAQALRLVAFMHNIGHYTFSYASEHVIESYYDEAKKSGRHCHQQRASTIRSRSLRGALSLEIILK